MERKATAVALAIAAVMVAAGLSVVPPAVAVSPDCNEEFDIPDSEPATSRVLLANAEETGVEDVTASGGDEKVTVRLDSNASELEFGVFVLDGTECVEANERDLSDCTDSEILNTTGGAPEEQTCRIDAPSSGTLQYFFHVVNQKDEALEYSIWMSV